MRFANKRASNWVFFISFVLILIGFIMLYFYCTNQSVKQLTYSFPTDQLSLPQEGLSISITISKQWNDESLHSAIPMGAQYDGVLTNNSDYVFSNWFAVLNFSEDLLIDSSWNGYFSSEGNQLTFISNGDTSTSSPNSETTFGAVIYATRLLSLESYTLTGNRIVNMTSLPVFWVLTASFIIWVISLITYSIIQARTVVYRKRQELDYKIIMQSVSTLTNFIDAKDTYTRGHSSRVAEYAIEIARRMKINPDEMMQLHCIALMHDCGKISIPDSVLKKPGKLTKEEYDLIKSHTTTGEKLLTNFTAIPGIREGALYHHERFDGAGYPAGLSGAEIPLYARIICVADSFDAMSSNRRYRNSLCIEEIYKELTQNAGKQFDPDLVPYMIQMIKDGFVKKIQEKHPITNETEEGSLP